MKLTRALLKVSRLLSDVRAVSKNKIPQRLVRRGVGKAVGKKVMSKLPK